MSRQEATQYYEVDIPSEINQLKIANPNWSDYKLYNQAVINVNERKRAEVFNKLTKNLFNQHN